MALLSFIEASRAFNIAESTLRYWVTSNKLQAQTEVRNGKEITVLDEDEILLLKAQRPTVHRYILKVNMKGYHRLSKCTNRN
jgi:transposase-like protein